MPRLMSRAILVAATLSLALAPFVWTVGSSAQSVSPAATPKHSSSTLKIGDIVPSFRAIDQFGRERDFANLEGRKGLVILFFRSADW